MVIDRGHDFPPSIQAKLEEYDSGSPMWMFRDQPECSTTRALNSYRGDHRSFEYLTPKIRINVHDLNDTRLARSTTLHFICSPSRAATIVSDIKEVDGWFPTTIYEPIPDRCVPEELPPLMKVLPFISVLSPNAEEALCLLSLPLPPTKLAIEQAASIFLDLGVGEGGQGCVIIRSGGMGAFVATRENGGHWVDAFWASDEDADKIVDVTGAGNSFLGGLAAGLFFTQGNVYEATFYASVSASFTIEQAGIPTISRAPGKDSDNMMSTLWNGDLPQRRLEVLLKRHGRHRE